MYSIRDVYGKPTYDEFQRWTAGNSGSPSSDSLGRTRSTADRLAGTQDQDDWIADSFEQLLSYVSFLTAMNKRLYLFFRGQREPVAPMPSIFRDSWRCFDTGHQFTIHSTNRVAYWDALPAIGRRVAEICVECGVPRRFAIESIREAQWAVIQHYGLWPTPLIDITQNLRVAASFALGNGTPEGYVYVCGMPNGTGSITFDADQHVVLARLHAVCPPIAKRPHYQEGFLVGRCPLYTVDETKDRNASPERSSLLRRFVARIHLMDRGIAAGGRTAFWDNDFPRVGETALFPKDDPLLDLLRREFGRTGPQSLDTLASKL